MSTNFLPCTRECVRSSLITGVSETHTSVTGQLSQSGLDSGGCVYRPRGEYSQHSTTDEPIILVRLLFDYDAPLFPVHKNTLVEFVPAKDLEE